jgi:hypothetical protein
LLPCEEVCAVAVAVKVSIGAIAKSEVALKLAEVSIVNAAIVIEIARDI